MILRRAEGWLDMPLVWRGAAMLAAAIVVAAQMLSPARLTPSASIPSASAAAPVSSNRGPTAAAPSYPAIAAHPLFYPTRQAWVPPPEPALPQQPAAPKGLASLDNYQLTGVVIGARGRTAVLKAKSGNKTLILTEGQKLDGWTLRAIRHDKLHFEAGSSSFDLQFQSPRWPHN